MQHKWLYWLSCTLKGFIVHLINLQSSLFQILNLVVPKRLLKLNRSKYPLLPRNNECRRGRHLGSKEVTLKFKNLKTAAYQIIDGKHLTTVFKRQGLSRRDQISKSTSFAIWSFCFPFAKVKRRLSVSVRLQTQWWQQQQQLLSVVLSSSE